MVSRKQSNADRRGGDTDPPKGSATESARSSDRKERVLHARIPEALDQEIKAQARELGVSVSNLVRNILRNTLGLVGDVVEDTAILTRRALGEEPETKASMRGSNSAVSPSAVVGWQQITLNVNAICTKCNAILKKGTDAAAAVGGDPLAPALICLSCLENVKSNESER